MPTSNVESRPAAVLPRLGIDNAGIAAIFEEVADLLELKNDNPFRIRAYRNAARSVRAFTPDIATLIGSGQELPKLPGIGDDLAAKIHEIVDTGSSALRERLRRQVPPALVELLAVPGLGPKRVQRLYHELGVETPQQLHDAAKSGRIGQLHGFGRKLQDKLLQAVEMKLQTGKRMPLALAAPTAEKLLGYLRQAQGAAEVVVAGSYRRMRDTVGDLDVVVAAAASAKIMQHFLAFPEIGEVLASGPTRASVLLRSGLQVDLRVIDKEAYGAALVYFTGSKAHGIAIRRRAQEQGLKLSEYGVFRGEQRIAGGTEASVYRALGLAEIPPELREDCGEIEAAEKGRLPRLLELQDLKGDLHAHSKATDGANTLEEMAAAARDAGLQYLAITDHSRRLKIAHGLDADALLQQMERIDTLNGQLKGITLLKGIEVDILENGDLDLPDEVLARLDLVVGAVHSHFALPRARQTRRILRAMEHRYFTILAHPLGRLIGEREMLDVDLPEVIAGARRRGCALELNAQPQRMDLFDIHCRAAKEQGVPICINSDAHRTGDFTNLRYGVGQARRGWLEKGDVLNTRTLPQLRQYLKQCFV
ncbi:DNA polymerase/3'-5' exonuclease PolX [Nevskia soli]|uniref:DNA polymerase/3'-5' exonuclease PolX n=1 Tax=Nevskia soli TaxID=418856 RepID=UPI00068C60EF|nr:DNA polymerase/3'-5' exonuclease PolX [Nevskia soli]